VSEEVFLPEHGTWTEVHCYPLADGGVATSWRDVSARRRAEEARHYLAEAGAILASSLDYETTLAAVARLVVPRLADWCAVDLVVDGGALHRLAVAHVDPAKVRLAEELWKRYPVDPGEPHGVARVIRTGEPEVLPEITDEMLAVGARDEEHLRIARELGLRSAIIVPLVDGRRVLGALSLVSAESNRRYTQEDLALAEELARRAAMAIASAGLHRTALRAREAAERAAREAAAANRAKAEFLTVMSHELRTPLNAIAGHAELIELGIHGPVTPAQLEALGRIRNSQRHLLSLINDVLNFAKLEAGHVTVSPAPFAVDGLLRELAGLVAPQLRAKGLAYAHAGAHPELVAQADREKAGQVLLNLLSNAIKFTPAGGRVEVRAEGTGGTAGDTVAIHVRDTGIGIPADKLSAAFEPFVQVTRDRSTAHEGTGLGLAISRDLARLMGGELTAVSEVGAGSTFTLTLPRARGLTHRPAPTPDAPAGADA
jgi:signal transduction histidine kinase